jgi:hypothetical protein
LKKKKKINLMKAPQGRFLLRHSQLLSSTFLTTGQNLGESSCTAYGPEGKVSKTPVKKKKLPLDLAAGSLIKLNRYHAN